MHKKHLPFLCCFIVRMGFLGVYYTLYTLCVGYTLSHHSNIWHRLNALSISSEIIIILRSYHFVRVSVNHVYKCITSINVSCVPMYCEYQCIMSINVLRVPMYHEYQMYYEYQYITCTNVSRVPMNRENING